MAHHPPLKCKCYWTTGGEAYCAFSLPCFGPINTQQSAARNDDARSAGSKKYTSRRTSIPCTHQAEKSLYFLCGSNVDKLMAQKEAKRLVKAKRRRAPSAGPGRTREERKEEALTQTPRAPAAPAQGTSPLKPQHIALAPRAAVAHSHAKTTRKPNTQNRTPLMCLSGRPALKMRLAASSKRDGKEWAWVVNAAPTAAAVRAERTCVVAGGTAQNARTVL